AEEACTLAKNALNTAERERKRYLKSRTERAKRVRWKAFVGYPLLYGFSGWFLLGLGGCTIRVLYGYDGDLEPLISYIKEGGFGFLIGIIGGLILSINHIHKELQ
ncbi:MAG: hypothetical protein D3923_01565, partial [Candidatus Electrothrix sp. AR3]|nr:hypothetical protein [Candidatus Electrothrix sp. AR3]